MIYNTGNSKDRTYAYNNASTRVFLILLRNLFDLAYITG